MKKALAFVFGLFLAACTREEAPVKQSITLILSAKGTPTRAADPDENRISDINLFIFNSFGLLEEKLYIPARSLQLKEGAVRHKTILLRDAPYTVLAAANIGYELSFRTLEEAFAYRYYMAYPDEYSRGIPMAACLEEFVPGEDPSPEIPLERLMAKVELVIDRTALSDDVSFKVTDVRVGGCPSSALLFAPSKAETAAQVFSVGFSKSGREVQALNQDASLGISRPLGVYLLENCQGEPEYPTGVRKEVCSYIEIKAEYHSPDWHTLPSSRLVYRFYLGEDRRDYNIFRNTLYRVTVRPEGEGLTGDSWHIDRGGLVVE